MEECKLKDCKYGPPTKRLRGSPTHTPEGGVDVNASVSQKNLGDAIGGSSACQTAADAPAIGEEGAGFCPFPNEAGWTPDAAIRFTITFVKKDKARDGEKAEQSHDTATRESYAQWPSADRLNEMIESARNSLTDLDPTQVSDMIMDSLSSVVMYKVVPVKPVDGFVKEECSFNFLVQKHPRLQRCYSVTGAVHKFGGSRDTVGYLLGNMIDRPTNSFYSSATEIGVETQDLAWRLCESDGRVTRFDHHEIRNAGARVHEGGFFHILQVHVHPHHRKKDLGLWIIHQALSLLRSMWTIAIVEASPMTHDSPASTTTNADESSDDESEDLTERLRVASASRSLRTHFARMGFVQAGGTPELSQVLFLTPQMYFPRNIESEDAVSRWKSRSDVGKSEISDPPVQHVPSDLDKEFAETSSKSYESGSDRARDLKALIELGASIHGSRAMFDAAANESSMGLERLEELVELGGDVNAKDENGNTPLHIAASFLCADAVELLLRHGASREAKNHEGETAKMAWDTYASEPCQLDFMLGMGLEIPPDDVRARISSLLQEGSVNT